jgi:predicted patatin/cPLA2 family phospholipase
MSETSLIPAAVAGSPSTAELLFWRRETGSRPGQRKDGRFVSLVIEGGTMRGVVSAGMVAALEQLGLRDSFDAVYGSSAGAISGAYFVAGQARYGTTIFYENINNNKFIDIKRLLGGKPAVSLEFLLDNVCMDQKPLAFRRVLMSDLPLYIIAASINSKRSEILTDFNDQTELFQALRASARIPFFAGPPVELRGDRFLDASLYESIPFRAARTAENVTDMVILLTRPAGDLRSAPDWADRYILAPYLKRLDPELARHYLHRAELYEAEIKDITANANDAGLPRMLPVQIPAHAEKIKPFEMSRDKLVIAAMHGFRSIYTSMGLPAPALVEIITPFDVTSQS